jgi:cytosine deaminase
VIGAQVHRVTGVRLADGRAVEVTVDGDLVAAVAPDRGRPGDLHLPGWLLLSAATEPHAHLDKALSWPHVDPVYGDLRTAISTWLAHAETLTTRDIHHRARAALAKYLANGITTIRTHVDLLPGAEPLRGVHALLELRAEVGDLLDLQLALLTRQDTPEALVKEAIGLGVDVLGGCPHLTDDPAAETARLLDLADRLGVPVDLHTDEQLNPDMLSIRDLCAQVRALGLANRVTASHCVSLGALAPGLLAEVVAEISAAGIGIVSLPITNLYLQGREQAEFRPRGITALHALLDAGIPVAAGSDNLRDPFNPMGRADPFETTSLLITAGHLDADAALTAITTTGRTILGLPPAGPMPGAKANLLAVDADSVTDALAGPGDARVILHCGRLVSRTTVRREAALPHDFERST